MLKILKMIKLATVSLAIFNFISVNFLFNYVASPVFVVSFAHVHSSSQQILLFQKFQ